LLPKKGNKLIFFVFKTKIKQKITRVWTERGVWVDEASHGIPGDMIVAGGHCVAAMSL
jgi:hypothetical protein